MNFSILFENDLNIIIPELFFSIATMSLMIYGVVFNSSKKQEFSVIMTNINWISIFILFITLLLVCNTTINTCIFFNGSLILDPLSHTSKILILISMISCLFISMDYIRQSAWRSYEYFILLLFAGLGLLLLVSSYDLISMYLAIELQSLSLYVLATYQRNSAFSTEAGLKYFVLGAVSSGFLLFGSSLIYGFSGTTSFENLSRLFNQEFFYNASYSSSFIVLGLIMLGAGLMFKLSAFPFHVWAPDVYEGSPLSTTVFFAIVPKTAIFVLFLRIYSSCFMNLIDYWQSIIIVCSLGSMLLGAFAALHQKKIKRLLVYSSIGHVGYMLVGLATGTIQGIESLLIYLMIYIVASVNVWTIVLSVKDSRGYIRYITDFCYLSFKNPLLAVTFALGLFSMAGVPPLAGFYAKFSIFFSAMESGMFLLSFVGVLTSVVSAFYYIRIIKIMYFEKPKIWHALSLIDRPRSLILGMTFIFTITFFINPGPLYLLAHKMSLTLIV